MDKSRVMISPTWVLVFVILSDDVRWLEFDPKAQAPFTLLRDRAAQAAAGEDVGETRMEE